MSLEKIRRAIISMIEDKIPVSATWVTVKSVTDQTCTVTLDELDIENILLGFYKSGVIVYPKVNTEVLVAFINNSKTNGAVIYVKETDHTEVMGDEYGGIGMTKEIAERLKRLEDAYETLQSNFNAHLLLYNTHIHSGGTVMGSTGTTSPDTSNVTNESVTPRTDQAYISNDKVKHGKG